MRARADSEALRLKYSNNKIYEKFRKIAISSGSACTTSNPSPSHVLQAIGLKKSLIECTMRIGIGKFNTLEEIEFAADYILEIVNKLKTSKRG